MNRQDFCRLDDFVLTPLKSNEPMFAIRNGPIYEKVKVAIAVRILSGASYLEFIHLRQMERSTVFHIFNNKFTILKTQTSSLMV